MFNGPDSVGDITTAKLIWRRRRRVKNVSLWESLRLVFININQAGAAGAT